MWKENLTIKIKALYGLYFSVFMYNYWIFGYSISSENDQYQLIKNNQKSINNIVMQLTDVRKYRHNLSRKVNLF